MTRKRPQQVSLQELFHRHQDEMRQRLRSFRKTISHSSTKGDLTEGSWIALLRTYLPMRYQTQKGFVVDSTGSISDQIDVIIFDQQYSPFLLKQEGAVYVPAESVYAVFEAKQNLNAALLRYAAQKAQSVRRLRRTSVPIPYAAGRYKPKRHFRILAGFLALEADWKGGLGRPFRRAFSALPKGGELELVCALGSGSFDAGSRPHSVDRDGALLFLLFRLLRHLQAVGTVPAMNLSVYEKAASLNRK